MLLKFTDLVLHFHSKPRPDIGLDYLGIRAAILLDWDVQQAINPHQIFRSFFVIYRFYILILNFLI